MNITKRNPLKKGFLNSLKKIKKNKFLFFILVVIQILFFLFSFLIGITYQLKIYENIKTMSSSLEEKDLGNSENLGKQTLKKIVIFMEAYQKMITNILEMVVLFSLCFLILEGFLWSGSTFFGNKQNLKEIVKYWGRFILISLLLLCPLGGGSYFILSSLVKTNLATLKLGTLVFGLISLIAVYFLLVSFCLLKEKLKEIPSKIFFIGIKKGGWFILSLGAYLGGIIFSLLIFTLSKENNLLLILNGLFFIIILVGGRIFLIETTKEIEKRSLLLKKHF